MSNGESDDGYQENERVLTGIEQAIMTKANAIKPDCVSFLANFPPIKSAIIVGQDGMQVKLEIPESEMANAVKLLAFRNYRLRVTIELVPNSTIGKTVQGDFEMKADKIDQ